jgi:hypothetical protein
MTWSRHPQPKVPRPHGWGTLVLGLILATLFLPTAHPLSGQDREGSDAAAFGTAALGFISGSALGLTGSLIPCSRLVEGLRCSRFSLVTGGVLGGVAGGLIGANDMDRAQGHAKGAGFGVLAGAVAGVVLQRAVRHFGWADAGAVALVGGAVGSAPVGAGLGFAAGAVAGGVLWKFIPSFDVAGAVAMSLGGMALGSVGEWIYSASQATGGNNGPQLIVPLTFTF